MKTCAKCGDQFEWVDRVGKRSYCKPCYAQYQREWRAAHPGATKEYKRKYQQAHPERVREQKRATYHRSGDRNREAQRLRWARPEVAAKGKTLRQRRVAEVGNAFYKYGLTLEQRAEILAAQGGGCAICAKPLARPHVDHDHACCSRRDRRTCGKCVRGLLCPPCNPKLGWYEKHAERLAAYLIAPRYETKPPTGRWAPRLVTSE